MVRAPCCDKANVNKGPWSSEEDAKLKQFIEKYGNGGNWISLPKKAGLRRCGKSCRLRWLNYLRPNIKHGDFSEEEDRIIYTLHTIIGSRWSIMAAQLPGRTDNDIKNYWNTKLKKKLMKKMVYKDLNTLLSLEAARSQSFPGVENFIPSNQSCSSYYQQYQEKNYHYQGSNQQENGCLQGIFPQWYSFDFPFQADETTILGMYGAS